jgi:hypothetical protein
MIWRKLDEEHVHEPMTVCIFLVCQVQMGHEKYPLNRSQREKLLTKARKPPIGIIASKTLH